MTKLNELSLQRALIDSWPDLDTPQVRKQQGDLEHDGGMVMSVIQQLIRKTHTIKYSHVSYIYIVKYSM